MNLGTAIGYLELDTSKFQSGLKTAQSQFKGFMDTSQSAGNRITNLGNSLKSMGSTLTKNVTLPLTALGTGAVTVAANFEKGMSQVAATMGMTAEEVNGGSKAFEDLKKAAMDAGKSTQFSASESAEALNYLALAGYDAEKAIETLPTVLNLAASGGLQLGYASDIMTDAMSALGDTAGTAENFVDKLAKTASKSNTSVGQLGEAILTVGGTAKVLAGGTTELNTALGILADNGIKGAEGGTALRNIILALTPSTDKAVAAFKKLGVETYDANGNLKPINETFAEMEGKLKKLSQKERTRVLSDIFNKVDLKSVNALLANSGERFDELSGYIANADGAASDMAETMNNNLSGQLTLLKSGLEGAGIAIGNALMPVIKTLVNGINNLVTWFNSLNPAIQTTITIFGLVAAAIGPVLLIVGNLCLALGGLITFFGAGGAGAGILSGAIAALSGPIGIAIGAITALIAVGVLLYKNWDEIKAKCGEIWSYICDVVSEFVSKSIQWLKDKWEEGKQWLADCWENVKQSAIDIWNSIGDFFSETIPKWINSIVKWFDELPYKIGFALGTLLGNIVKWGIDTYNYFSTNIPLWIESISNWFKELPGKIWQWLSNCIEKISTWGTNTYNKAKEWTTKTINGIGQWFSQLPGKIWQWLSQAISKVGQFGRDMLQKGKDAASKTVKAIQDGFKNLPSKMLDIGKEVVKGLWNGISNMTSWIKSKISGFIEGIVAGFSGVFGKVSSKVNSGKRSIDIPNVENADFENASVYSKALKARESTINDFASGMSARAYTMFKNAKIDMNLPTVKANGTNNNSERPIEVNLNIDKFVNKSKEDINEIMDQIAFELRKRRISYGGAR